MFGRLLSKILPKKREKAPITGRDLYGRNNVGYPTIQLSREIDAEINRHYRTIRPVIKFYKEALFFKWLPSIINNELTDEQLKNLSGRNVQMVYLLLFRDMLRHISVYIIPKNATDNWADLLAQEVLDSCQMLSDADDQDIIIKQQLYADIVISNLDDDSANEWIEPIAALLLLPCKDLYYWHRSLVNTILKKMGKNKKKR